jgi:hypothetical protein
MDVKSNSRCTWRRAGYLNRDSERIPRRLRRGKRANQKMTAFLTVEDSLQLAAGIFNV